MLECTKLLHHLYPRRGRLNEGGVGVHASESAFYILGGVLFLVCFLLFYFCFVFLLFFGVFHVILFYFVTFFIYLFISFFFYFHLLVCKDMFSHLKAFICVNIYYVCSSYIETKETRSCLVSNITPLEFLSCFCFGSFLLCV